MRNYDVSVAEILGSSKENEEDFWGEINRETQQRVKEIIESGLKAEVMELVQCEGHERSEERQDYRHGGYERTIHTKLGEIPIYMPRVLNQRFQSKLLRPYQRRVDELDVAVLNCFIFGCSTRNTAKIIDYLSQGRISHQTVSNIVKRLDEDVRAYHSRPLVDDYEVLFCDGLWVKRKDLVIKKEVILYVMGLHRDGTWEIVDFHVAPQEDSTSWGGLLGHIRNRGIWGNALQLIVGDEAGGLKNAIKLYYPHTQYQACVFHKIQNVLKRIKERNKRRLVIDDITAIWEAPSRRAATKHYWAVCRRYEKSHPEAIRCLRRHFEDTLKFYDVSLPRKHRFKTNNILERYLEEVRRRIIPMRYFKNLMSTERIIYALAMAFNLKQLEGDIPIIKFQQTI
jgi:transposase-like protein